jgi:hypothetical protein
LEEKCKNVTWEGKSIRIIETLKASTEPLKPRMAQNSVLKMPETK